MKAKILYQEKYKAGTAVVDDLLPQTFPPFTKTSTIQRIEVKSAGRAELNGTVMEFADLRVFVIPGG